MKGYIPFEPEAANLFFQLISARSVVDPGDPAGPFCASIPAEGEGSIVGIADDPVATAASNNPYLTTLSAAVQAAGLVDTSNGEGPLTILPRATRRLRMSLRPTSTRSWPIPSC
jgi:hypothetical protein